MGYKIFLYTTDYNEEYMYPEEGTPSVTENQEQILKFCIYIYIYIYMYTTKWVYLPHHISSSSYGSKPKSFLKLKISS